VVTGNVDWRKQADILLSMVDCLVLDNEAVYASSEFTTGKTFYDLCVEFNVFTSEDLKKALGTDYKMRLLDPNKEKGIRFARKLRDLGHPVVLTPNPLYVPSWGQPEYLSFWKEILLKKSSAVYFNEGWEYSNGCTFEYDVALNAGLRLFDHNSQQLTPPIAKGLIGKAIEGLESKRLGFDIKSLKQAYEQG